MAEEDARPEGPVRDRYAIYEMMDMDVRFRLPERLGGRTVEGPCVKVYRNVLEKRIEVTVGARVYEFREPTSVERCGDVISFVYGDDTPITDDQFFEHNAQSSSHGLGAETAFQAMDRDCFTIRFRVSKPAQKRANPRRSRRKKKRKSVGRRRPSP
jgi:hypothetical protein